MMESAEDLLRYYLDEVKDAQHDDINNLDVDEHIQNEAEQASEFLEKVGLPNLTELYQQGKEISENLINDSVKQKHLTEKQAQTVRSRVATLNKTLKSLQPRRKHRQDVRDVAWNLETSSTGTRSRSATPDSLDSGDSGDNQINSQNEDSDEDHQLSSLPSFPLEHSHHHHHHHHQPLISTKTKIKWNSSSSEPLQQQQQQQQQNNKKKITHHRYDNNIKGDIAHLGSANVILKAYQPLSEHDLPSQPLIIHQHQHQHPLRERSGSDPINTDVHHLKIKNSDSFPNNNGVVNFDTTPLNATNITKNINNKCSTVYIHNNESIIIENNNDDDDDDETLLSFEGMIKQNKLLLNENNCPSKWELEDGIFIDEFSDSEYQYLKPLLYVELVAIFDQYKISFHKKKASAKSKGGNVFGVNLSTLVMRDNMPAQLDNSMIPQIFQILINELNTRCIAEDGILRLAGQKQKLEILYNEIESKFYHNQKYVDELLRQSTVHELTGVLKKLLRDLPDPIFTMELFNMFYKVGAIPNNEDKMRALNLLVLMLPVEHRNTFKILLNFLQNIIENERKNRMGLHNVAMITSPSFFPPKLLLPKDKRKFLDKEELAKQINGAAICCRNMETILKTGQKLWTVPTNLALQARDAQKKALVRKKDLGIMIKERKIRSGKVKLMRSSTQYESSSFSGANNHNNNKILPIRIKKKDFYV